MTFYSRRKRLVLYISFLSIFIFLIFFGMLSSDRSRVVNDVSELIFSHSSGFYNSEFDLTIESSNGAIYYTLDGTVPTNQSAKYVSPIHITDATDNPNVYSMRTDVSTGFEKELIEKYSVDYPSYQTPTFLIDKCTVVRAVIYYGDDRYSEVKTASYFVDYEDKQGYENINVISLVTDPYNLFDYNDGMYVNGVEFDRYKQEELGTGNSYFEGFWWHWSANYSKYKSAEKEAVCQVFVDNELVLSQNCGIRVHGGGSRGFNPKSLNLYAREDYGGRGHFEYNFFANNYFPKRVTLFQGGDDSEAKLKDYIFSKLTSNLDFCTMDFEPYVLFLDGEYWGFYWLTEKYDANYINYHYRVLPDNVVIIKEDVVEEGKDSDLEKYNEFLEFINTADFTNVKNVEKLNELMDLDSFIDYFAALIYVNRCGDWPSQNYAMWRSRKVGEGKYNDGRWRWMAFDVNSDGMTASCADSDEYADCVESSSFFANIMKNDDIRNRLLDRILELEQECFSKEKVNKEIQDFHSLVDGQMRKNCERFWGKGTVEKFFDSSTEISEFYKERHKYIQGIVNEHR